MLSYNLNFYTSFYDYISININLYYIYIYFISKECVTAQLNGMNVLLEYLTVLLEYIDLLLRDEF